jgi:nitrite reductase/ring-hydroxylating ferredoxin subunit
MPEQAGRPLCPSAALAERGSAVLFPVVYRGWPAQAFALRYEGRPVAYLNRCAHQPAQMDWLEGEFLDAERRYIVCSMHGALYEPADGLCVAGPCRGARLQAVAVAELAEQVCWFPSADILPPADADDNAGLARQDTAT